MYLSINVVESGLFHAQPSIIIKGKIEGSSHSCSPSSGSPFSENAVMVLLVSFSFINSGVLTFMAPYVMDCF